MNNRIIFQVPPPAQCWHMLIILIWINSTLSLYIPVFWLNTFFVLHINKFICELMSVASHRYHGFTCQWVVEKPTCQYCSHLVFCNTFICCIVATPHHILILALHAYLCSQKLMPLQLQRETGQGPTPNQMNLCKPKKCGGLCFMWFAQANLKRSIQLVLSISFVLVGFGEGRLDGH